MGGDGQLQHCDYATEFIEFLKELEKEGPETEFLIVGDTFGFWELTLVPRRKACAHYTGAPSDFRSTQGHRFAHQGDHDGRESRL
jgi:UDP-2,3-diacylglucosamine pyrophosphatase LpxH